MEYLKFWNYVPKVLIGLLFYIEIHILIRSNLFFADIEKVIEALKIFGSEFIFGVFLLILLITISSISILFQNAITYFLKNIVKKCLLIILKGKIKYPLIQLSYNEFALHLLKKNKKDVLDYYNLKSLGTPEIFLSYNETKKNIKTYFEKIENSIISSKNLDLLFNLTYDSSLTQEQVNSNHFKNNIKTLQYSWIIFILGAIDLFLLNDKIWFLILGLILSILWIIGSFPFYKKFKIRFGHYLIWAYFDNFTVGAWAEIADREAF